MATYYVAGTGNDTTGTGATGAPWRTLTKAHTTAAAGDTILVRDGTYEHQLVITKANMTWRADTGHTPVINGKYHIGLMSGGTTITKSSTMPKINAGGFIPGGTNGKAGLVFINTTGVTFEGFVVQNSTGSGISISGSNATVRNNVTYFTYSSGILSNPGGNVSGILIENNIVRFASVKIFDTARFTNYAGNCSAQCVDGSIKIGNNVGNTIIRGNDVAWGFGEGINIGKYNNATALNPIIVEDNIVHDVNHTYLYVNASRYVHLRRNFLYCSNILLNMWDDDAPVGIRLADEAETYLRNIFAYNNVVVNMGYGMEWGGRHTESTGCYFGHNTFVGGPNSRKPAVFVVQSEKKGKPGDANYYPGGVNQKGLLENNVVDYSMTAQAVASSNNSIGAAGVVWRNNNWSSTPITVAVGTGDVVGLPALINNSRALAATGYPDKTNTTWASLSASDNADVADYQLTSGSPGRGVASSGSTVNDVTPPALTSEDFYENTRDATPSDRDLGAFEYGGGTPPTNDVTANFTFTPSSGDAPLTVAFTDTSTEAGTANIDIWAWDFGDGATSASQNPSHEYDDPGAYSVSLTVVDTALSLSDNIVKGPVTVTAPPAPTVAADFTSDVRVGRAPLTVAFTDLSGGAVTTWAWDFGDGNTSTSQNPTHEYVNEGLYDVTLTVTDGASASDTKTVVEYIRATVLTTRRFIVGPLLARDVEPGDKVSASHYNLSDDANTTGAGYIDVATNRARPVIRLTEAAGTPTEEDDIFTIYHDGTNLKVKLPDGSTKTLDWT